MDLGICCNTLISIAPRNYLPVPSISYLALFQSASYACAVGPVLCGDLYGCWVVGALEPEYDSCDLSECISRFRLFTFLIIQTIPANAIKQATPRTAPTAAPTTVVVLFEPEGGDAVTVDVTVAVVAASVELESLEMVEVPGTKLLMKRPR
jgi:hypothetical protein